MKKFLSLVLALVMTMSLVTISAGATEYKDLTDKSEITYEEAVAIMNKIGIISGYEDGSFKPTATLTRGAAAKIITYMMLGTVAAEQLGVAGKPYKDVALDNTFAPYIAYCKSTGLINGYSDGTFRPGAPLDGYSFSKMLMTALGYKTENEGFTGSGWQTRVASIAVKTGLYAGKDAFVGSATVTREEACLYAFNTLKATEVEYRGLDFTLTNKDSVAKLGGTSASFVVNDKQASLDKTYNNVRDGLTQFCEEHFPALKLINDGNAFDDFGRPSNKWAFKKATIGTYALTPDFSFTVGTGDSDKDENFNAKAFGMKGYEFGVKNTGIKVDTNGAVATKAINSFKELAKLSDNGTVVEIFTDPDMANTITDIVIIKTQLMTVSNVNANAKTVTLKINADYENAGLVQKVNVVKEDTAGYDVLSALKVDDMVLVTPVYTDGGTYDVAAALVPTTATGKLSKVNVNSSNRVNGVTVAGTDYAMSHTWSSEDGGLFTNSVNTKLDTTVYLDAYGYAIYVKNIVAPTSFILFDEMYTAVIDGKIHSFANGYDMSGNALSLDLGTGVIAMPTAGVVYQYNAADKGNAEYVLAGSKTDRLGAVTEAKIDIGTATLTVAGKPVYFASGVKFIFCTMDGSDLDTITVKDGVQTVAKAAGNCTYVLNGDKNAITAVIVNNDSDVEVSNNILYVSKYLGTTTLSNGKTVSRFDAYINGDKTPGLTATRGGIEADKFYSYNVNTDGNYELSSFTQATNRSTAVITGATFNKGDIKNKAWIETLTYGKETAKNLNAKNAVIVDLTVGNNFNTFASLDEKDNGIKSYVVSLIYNDGKTNAKGTVSYLFVTDAKAEEAKPEVKPGENTFVNTTVDAAGAMTTTLAYTRPDFMAAGTEVKLTVKVTCNGMNYGTRELTIADKAVNGVYTTHPVGAGFPVGADVKLEIVSEMPAAVNVKYIDGDTKLEIAADKLATSVKTLATDGKSPEELSFTVNTTTSGKSLTYTTTGLYDSGEKGGDTNVTTEAGLMAGDGKGTLVNDQTKAFVGDAKTNYAMGNDVVTVTIFGLSKLVAKETYSITAAKDVEKLFTDGTALSTFGVDAKHAEAASLLVITPKTGSAMTGNKTGDTVFLQVALKAAFKDTTNTAAMKVTVNVGGKTLVGFITGTATTAVDLGSVAMNGNYEIKAADVKVEVIDKLVNTGKPEAPSITHVAGTRVYAITFNQNIASANVDGKIDLAGDFTVPDGKNVMSATISGKVLTVELAKELANGEAITIKANEFVDVTNPEYAANKNVATILTVTITPNAADAWKRT